MNLLVHLGMERRLLEEGRTALERFPMASFDETPYSPFMTACRYAVAQPAAEMGIAAARLILERIGQASNTARGQDGGRSSSLTGDQTAGPVSSETASNLPTTIRLPTTLIRHHLNASNQGILATHGPGLSLGPYIEPVRRKEHG